MSVGPNTRSKWDRWVLIGTVVTLLLLPLMAAHSAAWPGLVALSFLSMGGLLALWKRDPLTVPQILWGALILRIAFLPVLPGLTDDLFRYVWDGWLQVEGINPYRYSPNHEALSSFQGTDLYENLNSQPYYSVYPPLTQLVFAVAGWFYSTFGWTVSYYVIKSLFTAAEFGGVVLLSRLTTARNLLLYAWNPLVLVETAGQGHSEALLMLFLLGAVWAVRNGWGRVSSVAVAAAGMVKLYPFVLGPFLLRRYGWSAVWPGTALVIAVSIPYAAPYAFPHLKSSVDLFAHLMEFNAGPYYLVKYTFWVLTGADWSKQIGPAFRYLFLAALPVLYYLDWRRDWSFRWSSLLTLGLFLALSTTVHPWYFLPVLALGVVHRTPAWPWFWVSICSIGTYLFYIDGPYWVWVNVGWGGAAIFAAWFYQEQLRVVARYVRLYASRPMEPLVGTQDAGADSK